MTIVKIMENEEVKIPNNEELHGHTPHRAREWIAEGGIIKHWINKVPGFRDFFYEELFKKCIPASIIVQRMREKWPKEPEENFPSERTIHNFRSKVRKGKANYEEVAGLAMRNEIKIIEAMDGMNYFEERKDIYDKICQEVEIAEKAVAHIADLMSKTNLPPQPLWEALTKLKELLSARSEHLNELDKLSVRFGLMPAMEEKNFIFAQQNNTLVMNDDQMDIINRIGLKTEDFKDENMAETMKKVVGYYSKKYGIGEQQDTGGAEQGKSEGIEQANFNSSISHPNSSIEGRVIDSRKST